MGEGTNVNDARPDSSGWAWSGGAVFAALLRRFRGTVCKNGDATGAARSTPRRHGRSGKCAGCDERTYGAWICVMGGLWTEQRNIYNSEQVVVLMNDSDVRGSKPSSA
jgi:hypothetical protein